MATDDTDLGHVVVIGAGCIGGWVGGKLAQAGHEVTFLTREGESFYALMRATSSNGGITLIDNFKRTRDVVAADIRHEAEVLADADLILLAVKRQVNPAMAKVVKGYARPRVPIVCLQNGLAASDEFQLAGGFDPSCVVSCTVTFNVVSDMLKGTFTKTSPVASLTFPPKINKACPGLTTSLKNAGFSVTTTTTDKIYMESQCGKLLINLFNAPNALSGLSTSESITSRACCRLMARSMFEALKVFRANGMTMRPFFVMIAPYIFAYLAFINPWLRVVVFVLNLVGVRMGDDAHSSMWQDLQRGGTTEIDYLNGVVVAMGKKAGIPTPINSAVVVMVKEVEGKVFTGLDEKALLQLSAATDLKSTRASRGGGAAAGEGGGGSGTGGAKPAVRSRKKGYKKR